MSTNKKKSVQIFCKETTTKNYKQMQSNVEMRTIFFLDTDSHFSYQMLLERLWVESKREKITPIPYLFNEIRLNLAQYSSQTDAFRFIDFSILIEHTFKRNKKTK